MAKMTQFTLIHGGRKPAIIPRSSSTSRLDALKSRTHPNLRLRYMVAEAREQIPSFSRNLDALSRNVRATESALYTLNHLCLSLDSCGDKAKTCSVVARELAWIVAQLESDCD